MSASDLPLSSISLEGLDKFGVDDLARPHSSNLLNVPNGSKLRFELAAGSSALGEKDLKFYCNYPPPGVPFDRTKYHEYSPKISYDGLRDWVVELPQPLKLAGFYQFYLQSGAKKSEIRTFNIQPTIYLNDQPIHPDAIVKQTFLTKCLGELDHWGPLLEEAHKTGYNLIHLTPVQQSGRSGSGYSIYDQLSVSSKLFKDQKLSEPEKMKKLEEALGKFSRNFNLMFMTDVVWNHTADNTPWLVDHPESGYNPENSPHLKVAVALDDALLQFSDEISEGKYPYVHADIRNENDVSQILSIFSKQIWPKLKLWEYFVMDVPAQIQNFEKALQEKKTVADKYGRDINAMETLHRDGILNDGSGDRFSKSVDIQVALSIFNSPPAQSQLEIDDRVEKFKKAIDEINLIYYRQLDLDFAKIVHNLQYRIRRGVVTHHRKMLESYFTRINKGGKIIPLANNGWIWGGNSLVNFASSESKAYFLRDVIVWEDTVKLRYGNGPQDNPWLWDHMRKYTEWSASVFSGLRIDNCHSTPIHVAQYMLDFARKIRGNLYVIAELFTGDPKIDEHFVAQLGLSSLIREGMAATDPWDLGRYAHRFGGKAVGSTSSGHVKHVTAAPPAAIFMDCTHDNETPHQKRTAVDALSSAALISMAACAIGSTKGYDELFPKTIDLVNEHRKYTLSGQKGIVRAKTILNKLHSEMAEKGFSEIHVHQQENVICIQRHNPESHEAVFMIVFTGFRDQSHHISDHARRVVIPAKITENIIASRLNVLSNFNDHEHHLIGLESELTLSQTDLGDFCHISEELQHGIPVTVVNLKNFPPGSVLGFRAHLFSNQLAVRDQFLQDLNSPRIFDEISRINLTDVNALLFKCDDEERVSTGHDSYNIPDFGKLVYSGLASFIFNLKEIRKSDNMGHPLFNNLRNGDWALDYIVNRLKSYPNLKGVEEWFRKVFENLRKFPRHLIPKYFDMALTRVYDATIKHAYELMSNFISHPINPFVQQLSWGSLEMLGRVPNAPLIFAPKLIETSPAAGLPHFSSGFMRCWGRDTFISFRGLMLITGRHQEAKDVILGFASCSRHGLIPNLLDSGNSSRFNARDATWFFLQAVQDYVSMVPNGKSILQDEVTRRFPTDSQDGDQTPVKMKLEDLVQEILQKHARGIHFREWNAGTKIDANMTDNGFNIDIRFDEETGLIFGGNENNCGTWMDKMGEHARSGNKGIPATPRDGADVEIIGLLKSTLRWVSTLNKAGDYKYSSVKLASGKDLTFAEWNEKIQRNFEKCFWVPTVPTEDSNFQVETKFVHRRGIYKDTFQSAHGWTDYQLRPNVPIAMSVAPELFQKERALSYLKLAEEVLLGPLGMATLDPKDSNYRPNYDMSIDSDDRMLSKGWNYHQGPEWVWVIGYFLRAKFQFEEGSKQDRAHRISAILMRHRKHITESPWWGIAELTNQNGAECYYSCPTQAWSMSCILDCLYDMSR